MVRAGGRPAGRPRAGTGRATVRRARCHIRAGDFAAARALYLRLSDSPDPDVRLRAAIGFEDAGWRPGLPGAEASALLARALDDVPTDHTDARYVWGLASLGRAMAFTQDSEQAREIGEEALAHARRINDKRLLTHALMTMMWHIMAPESIDRLRQLAEELIPLAVELGDWDALGTTGTFRSAIAYTQADADTWTVAVADLDRSIRGGRQPFMVYMRGSCDYARAYLHGDFAAAERIAEDLLELGRSFGPDDTEGPYGLQMYMVRRETGALDAIRPLVDAAGQADGAWEPGLLALYTEFGLTDAARTLLWRLLERIGPAPVQRAPWAQWTAVLVFLVEATIELRDVDAARRLRPLLAPYSGLQLVTGQFVAVFGPADTYLAALDSMLGDDESADRLFQAALAQDRMTGSVVHRAATLARWALHLRSRGNSAGRQRAERLRGEARRLATGAGQVRLLRMLDADVDTPAGLTARELDVLRLLARGSSNRDIATALRISENTAANHVRSILGKTGAANRTQVAMMAASRRWLAEPQSETAR